MRHHASKLDRANVVAGFDTQETADEALLELRSAGVADRDIGYYAVSRGGWMEDLLADHHRVTAAVLWGAVGALLGGGAVLVADRLGVAGPDPLGMAAIAALCGALVLGALGGIAGLWTAAPGEDAPAPAASDAPFVLAVAAGGSAGRVWEILCRRGAHELLPHAPPPVIPAHLPM